MPDANRHQDNLSRLDRIEAALELFIADHEQFREEHKRLLQSQVLLQDAQAAQQREHGKLERTVEAIGNKVHEIGEKLNALIGVVDRNSRDFHDRLTRMEEKH